MSTAATAPRRPSASGLCTLGQFLHTHNKIRYDQTTAHGDRPFLDVGGFTLCYVSNDFNWWQSHRWDTTLRIPVAFHCDSTDSLQYSKANAGIKSSPTYTDVSLQQAAAFAMTVRSIDRVMGSIIRDRPVHFYVEFRASRSDNSHAVWAIGKEKECRTEFLRLFTDFCRAEYSSQEGLLTPSRQHVYWWRCANPDQLSMQYHLTSMALELTDLRRLMLRFRAYVEDVAIQRNEKGEPQLWLCQLATEPQIQPDGSIQEHTVMQHLIRYEAYMPGYILCLPHNHAPGTRSPLMAFPLKDHRFGHHMAATQASMTYEMLQASPHYSLPSEPARRKTSRLVVDSDYESDGERHALMRDVETESEDDSDEEAQEEEEEVGDGTMTPVITALHSATTAVLYTDAIEVSHLSKLATKVFRYLLQPALGFRPQFEDCQRCVWNHAYPHVRGKLHLQIDADGRVECPCCPASQNMLQESSWVELHRTRPVAFTINARTLSLYCPGRESLQNQPHLQGSKLRFFSFDTTPPRPPRLRPLASAVPIAKEEAEGCPPNSSARAAASMPNAEPVARNSPAHAGIAPEDTSSEDEWSGSTGSTTAERDLARLRRRLRDAAPSIRSDMRDLIRREYGWDDPTLSDMESDDEDKHMTQAGDETTSEEHSDEEENANDGANEPDGASKVRLPPSFTSTRDETHDALVAAALADDAIAVAAKFGDYSMIVDRERLGGRTKEEADAFIRDVLFNYKFVLLKAAQGCGKSWVLDRAVREFVRRFPSARILWLSNRRMYAKATHKRLQELTNEFASLGVQFEFACYLDEQWRSTSQDGSAGPKHGLLGDASRVICSLESIERLSATADGSDPKPYDLVILDEVEELRYNFHSQETMKDKRPRVFQIFAHLLNQAKYIWAADADLDVSKDGAGAIRLLDRVLDDAAKRFFLVWNTKQTIRRNYFFHPQFESCTQALVSSLMKHRHVVVVTNSKAKALLLERHCREHPQLKEFFDQGERTVKLLTGDTSLQEKLQFMENKRQWKVNLLIYSPVISSGVDYSVPEFTKPWFHEAFLFAVDCSSTVRQTFQQLNRVRQLSKDRVHVHLDVTPHRWASLPVTLHDIRTDVNEKLKRCLGFHMNGHHLDVEFRAASRNHVLSSRSNSYTEALYLPNELESNRSKKLFEVALKQAIVASGGTLYHIQWNVTSTDAARLERDRQEVKAENWEAIANAPTWTEEQVREATQRTRQRLPLRPGEREAFLKYELNETYGYPATFDLRFVQRFGPAHVVAQFQRLQAQARSTVGVQQRFCERVRMGKDHKEHCLRPAISDLDTQLLLQAAGFVTYATSSTARPVMASRISARSGKRKRQDVEELVRTIPTKVPSPALAPIRPAAAPHPRPVLASIISTPSGDLFRSAPVERHAIDRRFELHLPSRKYWWPQLMQVQSFRNAVKGQQRDNSKQHLRKKRQLQRGGQHAVVRDDHPGLLRFEAKRKPEEWSGAMVRAVLVRALKQHLYNEYHIKVKTIKGPAVLPSAATAHSMPVVPTEPTSPASIAVFSPITPASLDPPTAGGDRVRRPLASTATVNGHVKRSKHLCLDQSFWTPVAAQLRPDRTDGLRLEQTRASRDIARYDAVPDERDSKRSKLACDTEVVPGASPMRHAAVPPVASFAAPLLRCIGAVGDVDTVELPMRDAHATIPLTLPGFPLDTWPVHHMH